MRTAVKNEAAVSVLNGRGRDQNVTLKAAKKLDWWLPNSPFYIDGFHLRPRLVRAFFNDKSWRWSKLQGKAGRS